ncbi:hypothetical protein N7495_004270 [Penicillium taxi]|uniref:uncharacterized protein n=1 Tax=Penicillium taxi TaxID=168475 RepID=UPI002545BD4F|nr:uncharacterized protein N7495_004270 [Penicillium taxi]KAJ5899526.1 hypothetical protein N7495_004270 [Penicillium taxi]
MKRREKADVSPEISRDRFRTPKRPSSPPLSKTSTSTISKRTGSPHISASTRWKRRSLPSSTSQSTLTQIDFVTQTTQPDEEQLDYLDDIATKKTNPVRKDDESEDDINLQPPNLPLSGVSTFERYNDHPKRRRQSLAPALNTSKRKIQTPKTTLGSKGKRKSTDKSSTKRDKTLTQMDFVRRYITIDDDDDDVNLRYTQLAMPNDFSSKAKQQPTSEKKSSLTTPVPQPVKHHHRTYEGELDLSTGEPISDLGQSQSADLDNATKGSLNPPVTPRKSRKLEIPSSQSPESPGIAIITSSQFCSATRSPLKRKSPNITHKLENCHNEESSSPQQDDAQGQGNMSPLQKPTSRSPKPLISSSQHHYMLERTSNEPSVTSKPQGLSPHDSESRPKIGPGSRMVVYETDGETDESDSGGYLSDDSQEIPLPNAEPSAGLDFEHQSETLMSDSSVLYQRMHLATQFPHEPIPTLNTQGLSALFATQGNTEYLEPLPLQSITQTEEVDQTEIVPESSPARDAESNKGESQIVFQRPRAPDSVVQVESSQPVDRSHQQVKGVLSRSQLLTSSMMDSVPLPQFWMGSQDSVGEPYSLDR